MSGYNGLSMERLAYNVVEPEFRSDGITVVNFDNKPFGLNFSLSAVEEAAK